VPSWLAARVVVDVSANADSLLRRLQAATRIAFDRLTPSAFEHLVGDLLSKLGFRPTRTNMFLGDHGIDAMATFQDREGFGPPTSYIVQVKRYRSPLHDVAQLIEHVRRSGDTARGLLITTSWLTSIANQRLAAARLNGVHVEVIDGVRLRALILRHPDLLNKHFVGLE